MLNLRLAARHPVRVLRIPHRCYSTDDIRLLLEQWARKQRPVTRTEAFDRAHLASLFATLPTRDPLRPGPRPDLWQCQVPIDHNPLPWGHQLAFFPPRSAEHALRADRTDPEFCPPAPFTRRMWVGGSMSWRRERGDKLRIGEVTVAKAYTRRPRLSRTAAHPMAFVDQLIHYRRLSHIDLRKIAVIERRTHVYQTEERKRRDVEPVEGLPVPDFVFEFVPTPTMLFRFSAVTFNAHLIHLDKQYATEVEGYPERLVHAPLTALMMLEVTSMQQPAVPYKYFEYQARNPLYVNEPVLIKGTWEGHCIVQLWAESATSGVIGMTGKLITYGY